MSILSAIDLTLVMDGEQTLEHAMHEELIVMNGLYVQLYGTQFMVKMV